MNASLQGRLVAGFVLAFLAGGAAGAFLTLHHTRHGQFEFAPHSRPVADRLHDHLKAQLDLTPAQMTAIDPLLEHASQELQQIRTETGARVRQIVRETNQAVKPLLNETQRANLDKIEEGDRVRRELRNPGRRRDPRGAAPDDKSGLN